ncbi:MAG: hypothetical protein IJF69_05765 [Clostridia bacterium]|nr:hypothetical protein [Clostridia bacterium]
MKKLLSVLLALSILLLSFVYVNAAECSHRYTRTAVPATCIEKTHLLFTCSLCGHSYKVYGDEYTVPDSIYVIASSVREGSTLTVTVELFNNPGIDASRLTMNYSTANLSPKEIIYGDVWEKGDYSHSSIDVSPIKVLAMPGSESAHNTKNGVFFTAVFEVIGSGSYGISFSYSKGDFPSWDDTTNTSVKYSPEIINTVGASEYGEHVFEFHSVITESTFTEHGTALHTCTVCNAEKTEDLPLLERWLKGDINNDGKVNSMDANLITRLLVGLPASVQAFDAADIDNNGTVNAKDSFCMRLAVAGG